MLSMNVIYILYREIYPWYHLVMTNIAMENHGKSPFFIGEPSISMGHLYPGATAPCCDCACGSDPPRPASSQHPTLHWFPSLPSWSQCPARKQMETKSEVPYIYMYIYWYIYIYVYSYIYIYILYIYIYIWQIPQNWRIDENWNYIASLGGNSTCSRFTCVSGFLSSGSGFKQNCQVSSKPHTKFEKKKQTSSILCSSRRIFCPFNLKASKGNNSGGVTTPTESTLAAWFNVMYST